MGATNIEDIAPDTKPRAEIIKEWNEQVQQSLYEDGHSYSGCIGMFGNGIEPWADKGFTTRSAASDYLLDTHNKWSRAMAVSFWENDKKFWLIGGWVSE